MSASNEEIARDIVVANLVGYTSVYPAEQVAAMYKAVLKAVGEAVRDEAEAHDAHYEE